MLGAWIVRDRELRAQRTTVHEPDLEIPHPRWSERTFVLQPLQDLAPELVDADVLARAQGQVTRVEPLAGWEQPER